MCSPDGDTILTGQLALANSIYYRPVESTFGNRNSGLTLVHEPTWATETSVQLDLESGTICRRTSDSRTCHAAVSDSRWRCFYL